MPTDGDNSTVFFFVVRGGGERIEEEGEEEEEEEEKEMSRAAWVPICNSVYLDHQPGHGAWRQVVHKKNIGAGKKKVHEPILCQFP